MKTIITIGRQYGSGGREVGQKLAEHYGIKFYDSELLSKVAKESGFCQEIVQQQDERPTSSFLYNLVMDTYTFGFSSSGFSNMPISQKVFLAQFDTAPVSSSDAVRTARCRIFRTSSTFSFTPAKSSAWRALPIIRMFRTRTRRTRTSSKSSFFARTSSGRAITTIIP